MGVKAISAEDQTVEPLLVVLVGKVSSGKSSLYNSLLRAPLASVHPRAGETTHLARHRYNSWLELVDTPGLEDVRPEVVQETREVLPRASVVLFLVNCAEGVTAFGREELDIVRAAKVEFRVLLSKADLLRREEDRAPFLVAAQEQLQVDPGRVQFLSTVTGEGVDELAGWLQGLDARGLDWARVLRSALPKYKEDLEDEAEMIVLQHSVLAGACGLAPLPLVDIAPIAAVQAAMAVRIGRVYGMEVELSRLQEVIAMLAAATLAREAARQLVKLVPGYGWAVSGGIAFGATFGIGQGLQHWYEAGMNADEETLRELAKQESKKGRKLFRQDKKLRNQARSNESKRAAREVAADRSLGVEEGPHE